MRGKEDAGELGAMLDRITPAYAGKSESGSMFHGASPDHPRVCGEKTKKIP